VKLSILLPSHNDRNINSFIEQLEKLYIPYEIVICNDRDMRGKGWAIRQALLQAKGDVVAFIDGDGDIPARMLSRMLPFLEDFDIVVGSKRIWKAPLLRKMITHLSRMFIRFLFGLNVDTQTGIKLFKRSAICCWRMNGFIFDVEILARAKRRGVRMIEVPIEAEITKQMSWGALWRTFTESLILWLALSSRAESSMMTLQDVSDTAKLF
jgi:glycosyltransferase involved in cell wall biosynthesis